jgi:hypothetical protein
MPALPASVTTERPPRRDDRSRSLEHARQLTARHARRRRDTIPLHLERAHAKQPRQLAGVRRDDRRRRARHDRSRARLGERVEAVGIKHERARQQLHEALHHAHRLGMRGKPRAENDGVDLGSQADDALHG